MHTERLGCVRSCLFERDYVLEWVQVDLLFFGLLTESCPDLSADLMTVEIEWPYQSLFPKVHNPLCPFMVYAGSFDGLEHFLWSHLNASFGARAEDVWDVPT